MVKHKVKHRSSVAVVKHRREKYPWEKHPPGSARRYKYPANFNVRECHAHTNADAFAWMVYWGCVPGHNFNIDKIVNDWWNYGYRKEFPEKGGTLADLVDRIYCRLIDRGHDSLRIDPKESDYDLPSFLQQSKSWQDAMQKQIVKLESEELDMAKITKKSVAKKSTGKSASTSAKQSTKKAPVADADPNIPAWITSSKPGTKAHESKVKVCELLMEQSYSDEEIALMVESEIEYKINPDRVAFYRRTLNKGQFAPLGFDAPDSPIQPIEKDGAPASPPAKKSPKSSAKASSKAKPSAKKSPAKKTVGKKKLVIKKRK